MKRTPIKRGRRKPRRTPTQALDYQAVRIYTIRRANGRCEADGLHAPACLGALNGTDQQVHHIWPREHGGPDETWNTMLVHPGCHSRIHSHYGADQGERVDLAIECGYLTRGPWEHDDRWRPWETGGR